MTAVEYRLPIGTVVLNKRQPGCIELEQEAEALAAGKPAVLDVMVDPKALVMPPEISLAQAANFGLAKIREALLR